MPRVLAIALIFGALVVVAMGSGLYMENVWLHAALSITVAVLIGLLLSGVRVLTLPPAPDCVPAH